MLTTPLIEMAGLLVVVLLISAGIVLWMKSQKKKTPHPMLQLLALVIVLVLGFAGVKWGGEALGIIEPKSVKETRNDPYRQALVLLQEPYPAYTSPNNLASVNRESLTARFRQMERLELADLRKLVSSLLVMIESAPATGQTGIYNMRMTSEIQARWDELLRELLKRVERTS